MSKITKKEEETTDLAALKIDTSISGAVSLKDIHAALANFANYDSMVGVQGGPPAYDKHLAQGFDALKKFDSPTVLLAAYIQMVGINGFSRGENMDSKTKDSMSVTMRPAKGPAQKIDLKPFMKELGDPSKTKNEPGKTNWIRFYRAVIHGGYIPASTRGNWYKKEVGGEDTILREEFLSDQCSDEKKAKIVFGEYTRFVNGPSDGSMKNTGIHRDEFVKTFSTKFQYNCDIKKVMIEAVRLYGNDTARKIVNYFKFPYVVKGTKGKKEAKKEEKAFEEEDV